MNWVRSAGTVVNWKTMYGNLVKFVFCKREIYGRIIGRVSAFFG